MAWHRSLCADSKREADNTTRYEKCSVHFRLSFEFDVLHKWDCTAHAAVARGVRPGDERDLLVMTLASAARQ